MKKIRSLLPLLLIFILSGFITKEDPDPTVNFIIIGNVKWEGAYVLCTRETSVNRKDLALTPIFFNPNAGICIFEFGSPSPKAGTYLTTLEYPISEGMVRVGGGGSRKEFYDGLFSATEDQPVILTTKGGRYKAVFKDLVLIDHKSFKVLEQKLSGSLRCD